MSKLAAMQAMAAQAASTGPNMTEVQKGGGGARLLPEGYAFARLVEYVELGKQPQEFGGKAKDPKLEAKLGFALYDTGDRKYANEDGTPYIIRPYAFSIDRNEKAKAYLLFKAMNWRGDKTHFAQMLGDAFLVKVQNGPKSKTDPTPVSRLDLKSILPPLDAASQMPYPIPAAREEDLQLFLWEYPSQEAWDALYVAGNWDDGRSKNYTQETIVGAVDFSGSPLEAMLLGSGKAVPKAAVQAAPATPALPSTPAVPVAPAAPAAGAPAGPFGVSAVVPVAVPCTAVPVSPGAPASSVIPATTSPSKPSLPSLPSLPVVPALPSLPK